MRPDRLRVFNITVSEMNVVMYGMRSLGIHFAEVSSLELGSYADSSWSSLIAVDT